MSNFQLHLDGMNSATGRFKGYVARDIYAEIDLVTFPFSLNPHGLAPLRCYAACDAANGKPADPYIAAELARHA